MKTWNLKVLGADGDHGEFLRSTENLQPVESIAPFLGDKVADRLRVELGLDVELTHSIIARSVSERTLSELRLLTFVDHTGATLVVSAEEQL